MCWFLAFFGALARMLDLDLGTLDLLATGACRSSESDSDEELSELVAAQTTTHTCVPIRRGCVHCGKQEAHVRGGCTHAGDAITLCLPRASGACVAVCRCRVSVCVCVLVWVWLAHHPQRCMRRTGRCCTLQRVRQCAIAVLHAATCATVCDSVWQRAAACGSV